MHAHPLPFSALFLSLPVIDTLFGKLLIFKPRIAVREWNRTLKCTNCFILNTLKQCREEGQPGIHKTPKQRPTQCCTVLPNLAEFPFMNA